MSLDIDLRMPGADGSPERWTIFIREDGVNKEISLEEWNRRYPGERPCLCHVGGNEAVYSANITHNLGKMAEAAGIYEHLWRPEEIGITTAGELIEPLGEGLARLKSDPDKFKVHNPPNGWGSYDGLVKFVEDYWEACQQYPIATVHADR